MKISTSIELPNFIFEYIIEKTAKEDITRTDYIKELIWKDYINNRNKEKNTRSVALR